MGGEAMTDPEFYTWLNKRSAEAKRVKIALAQADNISDTQFRRISKNMIRRTAYRQWKKANTA
jgi:hypothetical protein